MTPTTARKIGLSLDSEAPQANDIVMPAAFPGMTEARITRWLVVEGQDVVEGDVIAEIATSTSTIEIESKAAGRVGRILVEAGTASVKVATPIAVLVGMKRDAASASSKAARSARPNRVPQPAERTSGHIVAEAAPLFDAGVERDLTYREALRDALAEEMRRDERVFLIGVEVAQNRGGASATQGLLDEFGARRVVDAPPLEHAVTGLAVGAALAGLRPVVQFDSWRSAIEGFGQILGAAIRSAVSHHGGLRVPVVFRGPDGWSPGAGPAMSVSFAAMLAHIPGLKVVAPATPADAKGLLKAALRDGGPVAVLEHAALYDTAGPVPADQDHIVAIGRAAIAREGQSLTIVTYGRGRGLARDAAETLAQDGIDAEVIDLRSLRPLDLDTVLTSVRKTTRLITLEDGWPQGSIGSEICAAVAIHAHGVLVVPPVRLAGAGLTTPCVVNAARNMMAMR